MSEPDTPFLFHFFIMGNWDIAKRITISLCTNQALCLIKYTDRNNWYVSEHLF
jgi:hypothetical protein